RFGVESQLDRMLQPQVTLKSGGYIIINQTEALVAIDVNSGRSTKEHSIEETALHTNLEAAEEVARQLRLRDLAGLIVIDFIDMEENRNNRAVEKKLKDNLKNDRARIQVGRISHFGLLEMSRQRIRASVLESTMKPCPHCGGTGHIRSDSSVALHVVRAIEEFLIKDARSHITVRTPSATALYVLNHKRRNLSELEERFGLTISMEADETLGNQLYAITRGGPVERPVVTTITELPIAAPVEEEDEIIDEVEEQDDIVESEARERPAQPSQGERRDGDADDGSRKKRRRRRRRRGGRDRDGAEQGQRPADEAGFDAASSDEDGEGEVEDVGGEAEGEDAGEVTAASAPVSAEGDGKKRRRGKRGGKRNRRDADELPGETPSTETEFAEEEGFIAPALVSVVEEQPEVAVAAVEAEPAVEAEVPAKKPRRAPRKAKAAAEAEVAAATPFDAEPEPVAAAAEPAEAPVAEEQPARPSRRRATAADIDAPVVPKVSSTVVDPAAEEKPKKGGWWQRKSFF
ncbi:MAG: ribonuclease E/G, partial [Mesorhizobium sp.]|nr:ribonuclease E/G [Mesorhizobium sp.]